MDLRWNCTRRHLDACEEEFETFSFENVQCVAGKKLSWPVAAYWAISAAASGRFRRVYAKKRRENAACETDPIFNASYSQPHPRLAE